jgi:homoserine O-acetyltransferase
VPLEGNHLSVDSECSYCSGVDAAGWWRAPPFLGQTESDFIVKNFRFNTGEVLPELRLHYMTLGTVHRDAGAIDNAILLLHSTGGQHLRVA